MCVPRWKFAFALLTTLLPPSILSTGLSAADNELEIVARYLERLGLNELQMLHLEKAIDADLPGDQRLKLAKDLADLYANQLLQVPDDAATAAALQRRIDGLIAKIPQADTTSLRVMLLQADYNRAESLVSQWIADPKRSEASREAGEILRDIAPRLNEYQIELNTQAAAFADEVDRVEDDAERAAKEAELMRRQAVAGRATYFAGWSNYYLGLVTNAATNLEFTNARAAFWKLLDIESAAYDELDAGWLGLESSWRARAIIGLGLTEAALGNLPQSRDCFRLLEHAAVPLEIQDQAAFWYVQGLLNAGHLKDALQYATERIADYSGDASRGKVSLCVSLVRAGFADGDANSPDKRRIGMLGIEGLARLRQQTIVQQLIEKYAIELSDDAGFFVRWMKGRQLLAAAEKSKKRADYDQAADELRRALSAADASQHVASAAQCGYELAWCNYQTKEFEQAAQQYAKAVTGLKASGADTAVQAAWMAFVCYYQLLADQPRFAALAVDALEQLKRDFPNHSYAKRADYYINKIAQSAESPEATIRNLERIPADSPTYLAARYDICILLHQQWSKATGGERLALAKRVEEAASRYLSAAVNDSDDARKLKCLLTAVDVTCNTTPPDVNQAAAYLARAQPLADSLPASNSVVAEYHFRQLQLAGLRTDETARRRHAEWLVENAPGSIYEVPALVVSANVLEQQIKSASADQSPAMAKAAFEIYDRLLTRLGDSPQALVQQKNARIAASKAAQYASLAGQPGDAADRLEKLLAAFPNERGYLRRAGLAQFSAGQYARALPHWRTLLAGLRGGSDDWYEAKYHQLACLVLTDAEAAGKVFHQFELLHPDLGSDQWRAKFEQLKKRIN